MMKPYPHLIGVFYKVLEIIGHTNKIRFQSDWMNKAKHCYQVWFHIVTVLAIISHLISTCTRSIRYVPEFFQRLVEDMAFHLFYIDCLMYLFKYDELQALVKILESSFSMANSQVVRRCHNKAKATIIVFLMVGALAMNGAFLETYFKTSEKEIEILRYVYQRKYPERRQQTNFWIPYVDDSESFYYETIFVYQVYLYFLLVAMATCSTCLIQIIVIYLEGQYRMLCQYVEKIGSTHKDRRGNSIMYTDIIRRKIVYADLQRELRGPNKEYYNHAYEKDYCRQIVQFHQMLLRFQQQMVIVFYPYMVLKVTIYNTLFVLCMYQLSANPSDISQSRVFKLVTEFLGGAGTFFYLCRCSERLDTCNVNLRRSIHKTNWLESDPGVRKTLIMMLRVARKPNHLRLAYHSQVFDYPFFLGVLRVSYTFVNFMRRMKSNVSLHG